MLQHLHSTGVQWDADTIAHDVASGGCIRTMQWLQDLRAEEPDIQISAFTLLGAVESGQLGMCSYLQQQGVPFDDTHGAAAAMRHDIEVLVWVAANDALFDC